VELEITGQSSPARDERGWTENGEKGTPRRTDCGELRELRQLRDENSKLKRLVADLSLDRHMLQNLISKEL
jgi:hypothetical protein